MPHFYTCYPCLNPSAVGPGPLTQLSSDDDFYLLDTGLVVLQTTNSVYNTSLSDTLTPPVQWCFLSRALPLAMLRSVAGCHFVWQPLEAA